MKLSRFSIVLVAAFPCAAFAAGGGGGGTGGSASGGASAGAASGPSNGTSPVGTPNAGAAGAGNAAVSGVPNGPAQSGGLNNSGNDPSGTLNASKAPTAPGTADFAPSTARPDIPPAVTPPNVNGTVNEPSPGTNSLGTAQSAGRPSGNGAVRDNGTTMPGPNKPTATKEQGSDATIDAENRKLDKTVNNICRGC